MKHAFAGFALAALAALPLAAQAQFAKVEDAVKYRQSAFALMGAHMGRIGAVVKGEQPYDKAAVETDAAIIEMMSRLPWHAFPAGSETNSRARPEIWREQDKFKGLSEKMQAEVQKLSVAARGGDLAQIRSAMGAVGQSCRACHDNFRAR
ncbi:MAG TPA: cytochrome c [Noviherbaspirillum sp.]|nr:cytochrome c [Noviherbaspirillum sp.]